MTALILHESNKFDIVEGKIEADSTKQPLEENWSVLLPIPSFKLLVYAHDEESWHKWMLINSIW